MNMTYKEFIEGLSEGKILSMSFGIEGYGHYRDCKVIYTPSSGGDTPPFGPSIEFRLTPDGKEGCYFAKRFNGGEKIFYIQGLGRCTLQQIWKRVVIKDIQWANS